MVPYSTRVAATCPEKEKMNKRLRRVRVPAEHNLGIFKEEYRVCDKGIVCHNITGLFISLKKF